MDGGVSALPSVGNEFVIINPEKQVVCRGNILRFFAKYY